MSDYWGVPNNVFGPIDEQLTGALARVAMLSGLLENTVDTLFMALDHRPQETFAGDGIGNALKRLRSITDAEVPARPDVDVELRDDIRKAIPAIEDVAHRRNELIHGVWGRPSLLDGYVWRNVPLTQRSASDLKWTKSSTPDELTFRELIGDLIDRIEEIGVLRDRVEGSRRLPLPWETDEQGRPRRKNR